MIIFLILTIISLIVLGLAIVLIAAGGTIFTVFAADLIAAIGIIWLLFKGFKKKK